MLSPVPRKDRLDVLTTRIEAFENKHYPLPLPDPVEAIHMESRGLSCRDLEPFIGQLYTGIRKCKSETSTHHGDDSVAWHQTMAVDYDYDIAISFLSRDERVALELHSRLSERSSVFVYSKKQEEIAGTNGVESFRSAFRSRARLIVVLYREGWVETPWTRIEQTAITERVLNDGWDCLFFVALDRNAALPKWLPQTHIRFNFEEYGLEQAVGAIKGRLQELGGKLGLFDVVKQAKLVEKRAAFFSERERLFNSHEGVNAVRKQVIALYDRIEFKINEINSSTNLKAKVGRNNHSCVITNGRVSVVIYWRPLAANQVDHSPLIAKEYNSQILLPGERGQYLREPQMLSEYRYQPDLSVDAGWCWVAESKPKEYLSSTEVGDQCVSAFLKLVDRIASGELKPPNFFDDNDE